MGEIAQNAATKVLQLVQAFYGTDAGRSNSVPKCQVFCIGARGMSELATSKIHNKSYDNFLIVANNNSCK